MWLYDVRMAQYSLDLPVVTIPESGSKHVLPTEKELRLERDAADGNIKDLERRVEANEAKLATAEGEEAKTLREESETLSRQLKLATQIKERLEVAMANREAIIATAEVVTVSVKVPTYDELAKAESLYRTLEGERFVTDRGKVIQHLMRSCAPDVASQHPVVGRHVERWLMRAVWPEEELLPFWYIALNRS